MSIPASDPMDPGDQPRGITSHFPKTNTGCESRSRPEGGCDLTYIYIYPYIYYLYLSIYMYISIYLYLYTVSIYLYNIYSNIIIWEGMWTSLCSTHSVAQRCGKPVWWRGKNPLTESPSRLDLLEYLEYLRMMLEYEPIPNLDRSRGVFWGFAHKLPPWRRSHGPWTPLIGRGNHLIGRA